MAGSAMAAWLDSFFAGYDHFFLNILHVLADKLGVVLTPLMRVISFLGEKGIIFFLLALIFMLMADKRDLGVCIFGAVCCGALITNIILKDAVGRVRPFEWPEYREWWEAAGRVVEDDWSFPSGHVTACAAGMTAITLMRGKRWILPSVLVVFVMGVSRNYLMAHYPSDVLFAAIIGVFSGFVAWIITQAIFRFLKRRRNNPVFATILDFDIRDVQQFSLPKLAVPGRGAKKAAPVSRRSAAAKAAPVEEPDLLDDDVKTYSGSSRRTAVPGPEPTVRWSRDAAAEGAPAPRHIKAAAAEEAPVSRRSRAAAAEQASAPRRSRPVAAEQESAPRRSRAAAAEEVPAPRRTRAASSSGGRHAVDSAARSGSSRSARSSAGRLSSGGYQGKHVK